MTPNGRAVIEAAAAVLGPLAQREVELGPYCTYRVGGPAALFVDVRSVEDLTVVSEAVAQTGLATLVVGRGSNLLVADRGFPGIALRLGSEFADVELPAVVGDPVRAGGAALLPVVARRTASFGLTGFEWAVGVPGSVGGAVRMNAGGHGSDMAASLVSVGLFDLAEATYGQIPVGDLDLGYRHSAVGSHQLVLSADLLLLPGDAERSKQEITDIVTWRRNHQPGGQNAGSVFANPDGDSAGRLIDGLGLRGFRIGTAEVSTKHANFIQADPGGSADDVAELIREVQIRVATATGFELRPENRLIGFDAEPSEDAR